MKPAAAQSLDIEERLGDELGAAKTFSRLGTLSKKRGDFKAAEAWHVKALHKFEKLGDWKSAALTRQDLALFMWQR